MEADLERLHNTYPEITHLSLFCRTVEGRALHFLTIRKDTTKPKIFLIGTHHGNEWISTEIPYLWAEWLLTNYGKDPIATNIVENLHTIIIPMVNADGHVRQQRKNSNGVDINRNYSFHWCEAGSSKDPTSPIYKGPIAFSEPETKAVQSLLYTYKPKWVITYHSGTEALAYPWGYTKDYPTDKDEYEELGNRINDDIIKRGYTPYPFGQASWTRRPPFKWDEKQLVIYEASGICEDYAYNEGSKCFVLEISHAYIPDPTRIEYYFERQLSIPREVSLYMVEERKGQPSESPVVNVTVHPTPAEATQLTLALDKTEYVSGDPMVLSGTLVFQSDGTPMAGRTIDLYENANLIGSVVTDTDGKYQYNHVAPDVTEDTVYNYQAKFKGD